MDFKKFLEVIYSNKIQPCIGCGHCCLKAPCFKSIEIHNKKICPELQWDGKRHICNLMKGPKGKTYKELLYAGYGCSSGLNDWRHEPLQNRIPEKENND